jgi:hypothetical protein
LLEGAGKVAREGIDVEGTSRRRACVMRHAFDPALRVDTERPAAAGNHLLLDTDRLSPRHLECGVRFTLRKRTCGCLRGAEDDQSQLLEFGRISPLMNLADDQPRRYPCAYRHTSNAARMSLCSAFRMT